MNKDNQSYSIKSNNGIIYIRFFVNPSYTLAREIVRKLQALGVSKKRLWDFSHVFFDWSTDDLKLFASTNVQIGINAKVALVAADELDLAY